MPSRAVYTALARSRSVTGCSTVLIPSVEESAMITPEVVGHIDPVGTVGSRRTARRDIDSRHQSQHPAGLAVARRRKVACIVMAMTVMVGAARGRAVLQN